MALVLSGSNGVQDNSGALVLGTAVTASGTSVDFNSIPSWAKRITVMLSSVSLNATSLPTVRIGSGSIVTTGYSAVGFSAAASATGVTNYTAGFTYANTAGNIPAAAALSGICTIVNVSGNTWVANGQIGDGTGTNMHTTNGSITLGGVLDRVQLTTTAGTAAFDAGTINIMWE